MGNVSEGCETRKVAIFGITITGVDPAKAAVFERDEKRRRDLAFSGFTVRLAVDEHLAVMCRTKKDVRAVMAARAKVAAARATRAAITAKPIARAKPRESRRVRRATTTTAKSSAGDGDGPPSSDSDPHRHARDLNGGAP
jgi:hypothetical protein